MEFGTEKRAMLITRSRKRQITEEIELSNQERIRTHGEKNNYKYLGILEDNNIKKAKIKKKKQLEKSISDKRESFSKSSFAAKG